MIVERLATYHNTSANKKFSVVYAMSTFHGQEPELFLGPSFPYEHPLSQFRIVDARLSRHWVFSQETWEAGGGKFDTIQFWGYPEFAQSNDHRLGLIEGESTALDLFRRYESKLNIEFLLPDVDQATTPLGEGWVMCFECQESWQPPDDHDEAAYCPSCGLLQRLVSTT